MQSVSSHFRNAATRSNVVVATVLFLIVAVTSNDVYSKSRNKKRNSKSSRAQQNETKPESGNPYRVQLTTVRDIDAANQSLGGETGATQIRVSPADYPGDGSGETILSSADRANPRTISNAIVRQTGDLPNRRGLSNLLWAWGQFLDHDITLTLVDTSNGTADIEIEDNSDPLGPNPISFDRSDFSSGTGTAGNPRMQVNSITSYIDASNVYGSDTTRSAVLRAFTGGKLRTSTGDLPPENDVLLPNAGPPSGFLVGDIRGNENVVLTSLHTLFVREHNRLCHLIELLDPDADDESIYQLARKIVQAEMQKITYQEFLPALLGPQIDYRSVAASSNPAMSTEFATAAYRFGHSALSSNIDLSSPNGDSSISLTAAFFNPDFLLADPERVDHLLAGLPQSACQEIDTRMVSDLQTFLFGPPGAGGFDLAALNIQRGRDHGLADYNAMRQAYGLPRVSEFSEITTDASLQTELEALYRTVDNIDAWIGGLAEDHLPGSSTGPLVRAVLVDQFSRLRTADELFHKNDPDLRTPVARALLDHANFSLEATILANTGVRRFSPTPFLAGTSRESDIVASYDEKHDRIHIIGNREDNSLWITETGVGILLTAANSSLINGKATAYFPCGKRPNFTIDMGTGDDQVTWLGVQANDVLMALGEDGGKSSQILTSINSLASDTTIKKGKSKRRRR